MVNDGRTPRAGPAPPVLDGGTRRPWVCPTCCWRSMWRRRPQGAHFRVLVLVSFIGVSTHEPKFSALCRRLFTEPRATPVAPLEGYRGLFDHLHLGGGRWKKEAVYGFGGLTARRGVPKASAANCAAACRPNRPFCAALATTKVHTARFPPVVEGRVHGPVLGSTHERLPPHRFQQERSFRFAGRCLYQAAFLLRRAGRDLWGSSSQTTIRQANYTAAHHPPRCSVAYRSGFAVVGWRCCRKENFYTPRNVVC